MGENKTKFQKLTPNDDIDISVYIDAFDYIYENKDIRNVAITGGYSSGKSSVIETYKKICQMGLNDKTKDGMIKLNAGLEAEKDILAKKYKKPKRNFIHISFAHFSNENDIPIKMDENKDPAGTNNGKIKTSTKEKTDLSKEAILEGKIINQLIQQIPPENIPMSRFKVLNQINEIKIKELTCEFGIVTLGLIYFFNLSKLLTYRDMHIETNPYFYDFMDFFTSPWISLLFALLTIVIAGCLLFKSFKILEINNPIRRINIGGNEVEIFGT